MPLCLSISINISIFTIFMNSSILEVERIIWMPFYLQWQKWHITGNISIKCHYYFPCKYHALFACSVFSSCHSTSAWQLVPGWWLTPHLRHKAGTLVSFTPRTGWNIKHKPPRDGWVRERGLGWLLTAELVTVHSEDWRLPTLQFAVRQKRREKVI